ncbi:MAG: hypothetical protein Q6373_009355 [Candidatus Sigynarchaeota archaeon]
MSGIFHAFFGLTIGLLIWKLSEGKNGEKRFSLSLIFVFAINNYIGPDLGGIFKDIGEALNSPPLVALGNAIHSYTGFLLFALPYAIGWHLILLGIDRTRIQAVKKVGNPNLEPVNHVSYPKVLLMVISGGIMHHFVDCIGHVLKNPVSGVYYPIGRFILIPDLSPDFWLAYTITIAIPAIAAALYLFIGIKQRRYTLKEKISAILTKEIAWAAIFVGIVVLNVGLMYGLMAWGNLVKITDGNVSFYLGNLLRAARMFDGSATWWIAVTTAPTLVLFFLCHAKAWRFRIRGFTIRADLFVIICYLAALLVGYMLQPFIGNISGTEADAGALVFTWSTIGSTLVAFFLARDNQSLKREPCVAP